MSIEFPAFTQFSKSITEVQTLILRAEKNQRNSKEYYICIKSSILFLVAKFEAFLEDLVADYLHELENKGLTSSTLPDALKIQIANNLMDDRFFTALRNHKSSALRIITSLSNICNSTSSINKLEISNKFDYGKHGSKAVNHLFARVGIDSVVSKCSIYEMVETISGRSRVYIDIEADINALTNIRNNILHTDANPSVTHQQIALYKRHLTQFSQAICKILKKQLINY